MAPHYRFTDRVVHLFEGQRLWRFVKEGAVQILGGVAAGATNGDALAVLTTVMGVHFDEVHNKRSVLVPYSSLPRSRNDATEK
jgi:hypothetical protein